jgi:hypothetical protein
MTKRRCRHDRDPEHDREDLAREVGRLPAAVEVFRAKIEANEQQVQLYEAQIKAELAKTEVNKATVEVLTALVNGNRAHAEMYKSQIDAETAKVEADRVRM